MDAPDDSKDSESLEKTPEPQLLEAESKSLLEDYDQTLLDSTGEELPDWGDSPDALPDDWPAQGHVPGEGRVSETTAHRASETATPAALDNELLQAKAKLLVRKFNMPAAEAKSKLMPVVFANMQAPRNCLDVPAKEVPRDPRKRRAVVAPTGGA
jgi:hypothetical protein